MEIGGSKMKAAQKNVDAVNANIDQVTGQITKAQVGVKTAERLVSSSTRSDMNILY